MSVATLLCVGDIHLGRRPSRLPDDLGELGVSTAELTPAAAWHAVVRHAIRARVDAVVLTGDVVESTNARFEAFGHLRKGVEALAAAAIPVFAVAGNHDTEALPRMAQLIPQFRLLGARGTWETATVARGDRPLVRLVGWSFPSHHVTTDPLASLPPPSDDGLPTIGLLHCELDHAGSRYAPVWSSELAASYPQAWLLGHIHRPSLVPGPRPIGYLGSLVGLSPGEPGLHGPWLATVAGDGAIALTQLALGPLRWQDAPVDVASLTDLESFEAALTAAIEHLHAELGRELGDTRAVGCRIVLVGQTPHHRRLRRLIDEGDYGHWRHPCDGVVYFVHEIRDDSRPLLDLESMARGSDPPALLARHVLSLERGGPEADELIAVATRRLRDVAAAGTWSALPEPPELTADAVRDHLRRAALQTLEELVAQADERETAA